MTKNDNKKRRRKRKSLQVICMIGGQSIVHDDGKEEATKPTHTEKAKIKKLKSLNQISIDIIIQF